MSDVNYFGRPFSILDPVLGWHADLAGIPASLTGAGLFFTIAGLGAAVYLIQIMCRPNFTAVQMETKS